MIDANIDAPRIGVERRRARRGVAILTAWGALMLSACGGGGGADASLEPKPNDTTAAPATTEAPTTTTPETTQNTEGETGPSTTTSELNTPASTTAESTEQLPDYETAVESSYDEYGFPKEYVRIPAGTADGEVFIRMMNNISACVNYCAENPDLIDAFGLREEKDDAVKESLLVSTPEFYKSVFANGSDKVLARVSYQIPEDANYVTKTLEQGFTVDGNQVYKLGLSRENVYSMQVDGQNGLSVPFEKDGYTHIDYWYGSVYVYTDFESQEIKLVGLGMEQSA